MNSLLYLIFSWYNNQKYITINYIILKEASMKKVISILLISLMLLTSCNTNNPEDEDATIKRCTYIKNFMDEVFRRIKAKDNYQSVMNVDFLLIIIWFKNVDGNQSSVYYYVKDKKLYAGPVWNLDLGLNVVGRNQVDATYDYYASSTYWIRLFNALV